ncbi:TFIID-18kDa-domain-containing protein [Schizophyllum commune H4-8]|uniref:TFIID-18kDa-domain-containing protein n=1 Tax=Schizophyllum commune (strain H4-8 / FGSC 9210) TaxID=578458 RepID=UPI0021608EAA|nr:TFIID-18kDa-domain-containing protein [Schizophyllum commune H4-8]KAI5893609.1 TFIID-18kDa-domain-containing protein [Schizophyllum commune H4-8]
MASPTKKSQAELAAPSGAREYRYTQEISQMMFVFGEVQDPNPETVNLVEDIVRGQIVELLVQARSQSLKRGARSITAEDLIFFIRHDRARVNRLLQYLSWKDVRKHAKDQNDGTGLEPGDSIEEEGEESKTKAQKITIKLPWEVTTVFSEVLRNDKNRAGYQSDEEEDEDDIEAYEASVARLREADEVTRQMTRDEYAHYTECRQASFTYRKAKRFRDFLNLPPSLDLKTGDDTIDIVGFLAFEMVRSLTLAGLAVKKALEEAYLREDFSSSPILGKRKANSNIGPEAKRMREDSPEDDAPLPVNALFLPPPEARTALAPEHIQDAFSRMQTDWSHRRFAGMKNFRGGLVRTRVSLI